MADPANELPLFESDPNPVLAFIEGSQSDAKVVYPGVQLARDEFKIPLEWKIVSAHRTPEWMFEYAKTAAARGIKVIIAAAGGSAHLPGMVASLTHIPVLGLPIATTMDPQGHTAVASMWDMPPGVSLAVMPVNKARSAAQYAAKILAEHDPALAVLLEQHLKEVQNVSPDVRIPPPEPKK